MNYRYTLALCCLVWLNACKANKEEPKPGHAQFTFTRSLYFPGSSFRRDTSYTTNQIPFYSAFTNSIITNEELFVVRFGATMGGQTLGPAEQLTFYVPKNDLKPGLIGRYQFKSRYTGPSVTAGVVQASYEYWYYPHHNHMASFDALHDVSDADEHFTISSYDTKRNLVSGSFRMKLSQFAALPPYFGTMSDYELLLSGSFENMSLTR